MSAEVVECGAVTAAAASSTTAMPAEAVDAVEATEAERAFARLERLYAQLPSMEEKGVALARARSAAEVDGLAKAAAYRGPSSPGPTRWWPRPRLACVRPKRL